MLLRSIAIPYTPLKTNAIIWGDFDDDACSRLKSTNQSPQAGILRMRHSTSPTRIPTQRGRRHHNGTQLATWYWEATLLAKALSSKASQNNAHPRWPINVGFDFANIDIGHFGVAQHFGFPRMNKTLNYSPGHQRPFC